MLFPPPCEGGAKGGGPVSVECTGEACLARSIDGVVGAYALSPAMMACRFRTSLGADDEYTDDAEVVRPTPPDPPFTRGGKVAGSPAMMACRFRTSLRPNDEHTDDAEVLWPPPLHKGGKSKRHRRLVSNKNTPPSKLAEECDQIFFLVNL